MISKELLTTAGSSSSPAIISDPEALLRLGICKVPIPLEIMDHQQQKQWASQLTKVTPLIMAAQGDGEYAFYRNIMEEPELGFPLDKILALPTLLQQSLQQYFGIIAQEELRLDDAFCVHYNNTQSDTSGAKHMDPSDVTINMCIEKTVDVEGSHVLFHGTKSLPGVDNNNETTKKEKEEDFRFLVPQEEGFATIHYGSHPHETTPLLQGGRRTNIILTYCYVDESKSDVNKRSCYFT